jgi:hypothetical protein
MTKQQFIDNAIKEFDVKFSSPGGIFYFDEVKQFIISQLNKMAEEIIPSDEKHF